MNPGKVRHNRKTPKPERVYIPLKLSDLLDFRNEGWTIREVGARKGAKYTISSARMDLGLELGKA